jgi:predicted phosphate transport protein (TIGR00153 family)
MSRVSKKEDIFYTFLKQESKSVVGASRLYQQIFEDYPASVGTIPEMKRLETENDHLVHDLLTQLNESFITPFDREDISALALKMDDIVDGMESVTRRLVLFHVGTMRPEAVEMAHLTNDAVRELDVMFEHLPDFKKDPVVMEQTRKVHDIEDQADDVYHGALARLYEEVSAPPVHIMKWSTLFDLMENTLDKCKHVSTIVSSVVLKNA